MKRPFTFINVAMSADGKIATSERRQTRISGSRDFERVDGLRASSDAVMVGIGTVLADNPSLTVKSEERRQERMGKGQQENPIRAVVDSMARTPIDADILHKGEGRRVIIVAEGAPAERLDVLRRKAEIIACGSEQVDLAAALEELYNIGVRRLMVEGGATLNWALISSGLVDEVYTYIGSMIIGGKDAPTPVDGRGYKQNERFNRLELIEAAPIEDGIIIKWRVRR